MRGEVPSKLLKSHAPADRLNVGKMLAANFWYEPACTRPYTYVLPDGHKGDLGAAMKDKIEVQIGKALCAQEIEAKQVPTLFANWPLIYLDWNAQRKSEKKPIVINWARYSTRDLGKYVECKDGRWQKSP